jgi:hypothetical protein
LLQSCSGREEKRRNEDRLEEMRTGWRDEDKLEETEEEVKQKEKKWPEELEEIEKWGLVELEELGMAGWGSNGSSGSNASSGSRISGNPGLAARLEVPGMVSGPVLRVPDVVPGRLLRVPGVRRPPIVQIWTMNKARFQNWQRCQVGFPPLFQYNCV